MRKIVRSIAVVAVAAGALGTISAVPMTASQSIAAQPTFLPICNPLHPIYPCQNYY
jgi:hypothetical protein